MLVFDIIWNDILPLFAFIAAGLFLDTKFKIDIGTYSKLNVWVVLPSFVYYNMVQFDGSIEEMWVLPALALLLVLTYSVSFLYGHFFVEEGNRRGFRAISTFPNSGHIGVALVIMIYSHPPFGDAINQPLLSTAMGTMIILMLASNLLVNTVGAAMMTDGHGTVREFLKFMIKMPSLYAVLLAIITKMMDFPVEHTFLWPVLEHFNGAFVILTTVTVGIQLHRSSWGKLDKFSVGSFFIKCILAPLIALLAMEIVPPSGPVAAQVFFIYAAVPSSIALVIYSVEYNKNPSPIVQSVLLNTLLGVISMTTVIYVSHLLFPVGG